MKIFYTLIMAALFCSQLFAGGIVTNSNQSIQYLRMLARSASVDIDAVYYNPAGVMRLDNGFHLSLSNMSLFQTRTLNSSANLPIQKYNGEVNAYLYPNIYAVYKKDKMALSFGFGPNGGGGTAEFKSGLPSFKMLAELGASSLPALMTSTGIPTTEYLTDVYFKGSSVYFGSQLNFAYEINDILSVAAGVRMINAKNAYKGHVKILTNPAHPLNPAGAGNMSSTPAFFNALAGASYGAADGLQPLIDNSVPNLEAALGAGAIDQATYDQLTGGLGTNYTNGMDISTVQALYNGAGDQSTGYATLTGDQIVDAKQSGLAFTPILNVNITPIENLNIAIKYEFNTALKLKNDTKVDGTGSFTDDSTFRADIPAVLAIGIEYQISDKFRTQISHVTYFDKGANWEGREKDIDKNLFELAVGLEYDISEKLTISGGYSLGQAGPKDAYQSELSYTNSSHTLGLGVKYKANDKLTIDIGGMNTVYTDHKVDYPIEGPTAYSTTYGKKSMGIGIGLAYVF